jgi:GNAT superfamily N-acetyltransferase
VDLKREPVVRDAEPADVAEVVRVAGKVGQDQEWAGGDEHYLQHLMATGRLVVAEQGPRLVGYGTTRTLDSPTGPISMLADLFVSPDARGAGLGRAMLERLWADDTDRMTFSSTHPSALPLYAGVGLAAWWPLLYLSGDPSAMPRSSGLTVAKSSPDEAASLEQSWVGLERSADYSAWSARPGGGAFVVRRDGRPLATSVVAGKRATLEHLRMAPGLDDAEAIAVVAAAVSQVDGPVAAYLPAPHPAVRVLLAAGWRIEEYDLFMATRPDLLDPCRDVPSPALG